MRLYKVITARETKGEYYPNYSQYTVVAHDITEAIEKVKPQLDQKLNEIVDEIHIISHIDIE